MQVTATALPDVLILEPRIFGDERGFFMETYNARVFAELSGRKVDFVQDNHSRSGKGVLRGLHYQIAHSQGKLVRAILGEIFDVAVDLRRASPHFGKWTGTVLSAENRRQLWVPEGFAHGFLVLSEYAEVAYKTTDYYSQKDERSLLWSDPRIGISWPLSGTPQLSEKDASAPLLEKADLFP